MLGTGVGLHRRPSPRVSQMASLAGPLPPQPLTPLSKRVHPFPLLRCPCPPLDATDLAACGTVGERCFSFNTTLRAAHLFRPSACRGQSALHFSDGNGQLGLAAWLSSERSPVSAHSHGRRIGVPWGTGPPSALPPFTPWSTDMVATLAHDDASRRHRVPGPEKATLASRCGQMPHRPADSRRKPLNDCSSSSAWPGNPVGLLLVHLDALQIIYMLTYSAIIVR